MPGGSAFLQVMPAAGVDGGADPSGVPLGDREGNEGLLAKPIPWGMPLAATGP